MKKGLDRIPPSVAPALALSVPLCMLILVSTLYGQGGGAMRPPGVFDILALPRVWVGALFCLAGLALLARARVGRRTRIGALAIAFFAFGVFFLLPLGSFARGMGLHPSPMCSMTKPFLFANAGRGVPIVFPTILASIVVLSLVGNKLFCGWVCPVGAIQEIVHRLVPSSIRRVRLPFRATNTVRVLLFLAFVPLVFLAGFSLYDYVNPFEFLHWGFQPLVVGVMLVTLVAAVFLFRPFCYVVCPVGLFTWLFEHVTPAKIRVDRNACTDCRVCVTRSPCGTMPAILEEKWSRPDCHACGACIETCPTGALRFGR